MYKYIYIHAHVYIYFYICLDWCFTGLSKASAFSGKQSGNIHHIEIMEVMSPVIRGSVYVWGWILWGWGRISCMMSSDYSSRWEAHRFTDAVNFYNTMSSYYRYLNFYMSIYIKISTLVCVYLIYMYLFKNIYTWATRFYITGLQVHHDKQLNVFTPNILHPVVIQSSTYYLSCINYSKRNLANYILQTIQFIL